VAGNASYTPVFTVGTVSVTTPAGGKVTFAASTAAFDFDPPPGVTGNGTFPYTVGDNGEPAPSQCRAPQPLPSPSAAR
jgi:hypothetical protein